MSQLKNSPTFFVCSYLHRSTYRSETVGMGHHPSRDGWGFRVFRGYFLTCLLLRVRRSEQLDT